MTPAPHPVIASPPAASTQQTPAPSLVTSTPRHHVHHAEKTGPFSAFQSLLYLIVIAIFIITFTAQPFRIPSESMESTLLVGDFLMVNKQSVAPDGSGLLLPAATIRRGDIIVFHDPVDSSLHLVKRVIGLPGDRLRLRAGRVFINGQPLTEPYAVYRPGPPDNFRDNFPRFQSADPEIDSHWWIRMRSLIDDDNELIIPTGNYFVLGDNRNDSEDSRYWGFVPRANIVGKPILIYFSLRQPDADAPTLTRTTPSSSPRLDALLDFARWGRTLHIVR
jgi:signal peptidase I